MPGIYDTDGKYRVTMATTEKGIYAADGSLLVEYTDGTSLPMGLYNSRGNYRVTSGFPGFYAPNGSWVINAVLLGPELSAAFVPAGSGWTVQNADVTHIVTFGTNSLRYQSDTTSPVLQLNRSVGNLTVGKTYRVIVTTSAFISGTLKSDSFGGAVVSAGLGTTTQDLVATNGVINFLRNSTNVDLTLSNISIRQVL